MSHTLASQFNLAEAIRWRRSLIMATGDVGTGKTRFGLTGPEPILVQSFDRGTEGVIEEFLDAGKEIYLKEYEWSPGLALDKDELQKVAKLVRDEFTDDTLDALKAGVRTIEWDKETDLWECFRYAQFGKPNDTPRDYGPLNQKYRALVNEVKKYDASLVAIEAMVADWGLGAGGKFTKLKTRSPGGFDRLNELVYTEMHFRRELETDDAGQTSVQFYIDTGKVRQNSALANQTFPAMTFAEFGTLLLPDTTIEDWS